MHVPDFGDPIDHVPAAGGNCGEDFGPKEKYAVLSHVDDGRLMEDELFTLEEN